MNDEKFDFDNASGISVEEQKEILAKINGIAEKNRQRLSQNASIQSEGGKRANKSKTVKAKKSSAFFPVIVNIAALVILCGGVFALVVFNEKKDIQVRQGSAVYNLTERALIDEIRKETQDKIAAKELEINSISSRLEDVDAQLAQLYSSNQELTAEQLDTQEQLLTAQSSFRANLTALHEERSQILEDSRSREARLRAQLEERSREFAAAQQSTTGELDAAREELLRLSEDQEKAAAVEAQMAGSLASINLLIQDGDYERAENAAAELRQFSSSGNLANIRSFQAKREFYNNAIDSLETAIVHLRAVSSGDSVKENHDLQERNSQLENTIAEMQQTLDAYSSGSSEQARRLSELEGTVSSLRASNSSLETASAGKDRTISSLESERNSLTQNVSRLTTANEEQARQISDLEGRLAIIQQALSSQ